MNRRMALLAAGAIALAGMGGFAALELGGSDGRVTLKSRILDYEKSLRTMRSRPGPEETDEHITAMMGEYFRIGMSYEEVLKILGENDLTVDATALNDPDERFDALVYFDLSAVSIIRLPSLMPLVNLQYRLIFRFYKNKGLDTFDSTRVGTGP